jgi:hypothetical protein
MKRLKSRSFSWNWKRFQSNWKRTQLIKLDVYELDVIRRGDVAGATADDDVELTSFRWNEDWVIEEFAKLVWILQKSILEERRRFSKKNWPRRGNDSRCNENIERRMTVSQYIFNDKHHITNNSYSVGIELGSKVRNNKR